MEAVLAYYTEQKAIFFNAAVHHASTLMAQFVSKGALTLTLNRDIVQVVIGDLLFDRDDEAPQSRQERSLAFFKPLEDAYVVFDASD